MFTAGGEPVGNRMDGAAGHKTDDTKPGAAWVGIDECHQVIGNVQMVIRDNNANLTQEPGDADKKQS